MAEVDIQFSSPSGAAKSRNAGAVSQTSHRRFPNVGAFVKELGGNKGFPIEKVLIANNGVAAVKAIRSIRRWAYEIFGDERAIKFVIMATPEDMRANAEYIRMADVIVDVPGGSNNHNYANVTLIVELARLHGVNAVWAGWGHASENPLLPSTLASSTPPIKFIGPAGPSMQALGDKIGSTIIAQSAGVPCIAWNGSDVTAEYDIHKGSLPDGVFDEATIHSAEEASEAAKKIGFPIMIKASEGGGGKGIRKVEKLEDVPNAFRQVCGEVPGSPIFIMKLSQGARHLEVQLMADEYGNAVALNGRDCSVQRRHQKIIEEGPPVAAAPDVWLQMEKAAVALAKAVGYANAGTVEYLYSESEAKFYFLELNPRLQVEHPVTEMITGVNLPACQLQVAMGIPLNNIPEIREMYGRNRFEEAPDQADTIIDFDTAQRRPANGHCIAVRITAENAAAGFKPTSGGIQELNFRSTPSVWGYFSMDSSGSIHEFADSQFGHLFANGADREQARRSMVLALKELSIRGDISTTVDYISKLIELDDYVGNCIDTSWLDGIIMANVDGLGSAAPGGLGRCQSLSKISDAENHMYVVMGATVVAYEVCIEGEKQFTDLLGKGQLPPRSLLKMQHDVELILSGVKYRLTCTRHGLHRFSIALQGRDNESVQANVRVLSDGGFLIEIDGTSHVVYLTSKSDAATGMRLSVAGSDVAFSPDYDPTSLRTDVAGKLVKKLVPDGAHVKKGEAYAEIEVMKMFMPLKVEEAGIVQWCSNEGASLGAGDLLANLVLDNPDNVTMVAIFDKMLQVQDGGSPANETWRPHLALRSSLDKLNGALSGYAVSVQDVEKALDNVTKAVTDASLPALEIDEQLSVLSGRIPAPLFQSINELVTPFRESIASHSGEAILRFPSEHVLRLIDEATDAISDQSEKTAFMSLTSLLRATVLPYTRSKAQGVPGAERALLAFMDIIRNWINVERWFCDGRSYADCLDSVRKGHKDDPNTVLTICRTHEQLPTTSHIISQLMQAIGDGSRIDPTTSTSSPIGKRVSCVAGAEGLSNAIPAITEIGSMGHTEGHAKTALLARKIMMQESMPNLDQRKQQVLDAASKLTSGQSSTEADRLLGDQVPLLDIFYPLLTSVASTKNEIGLLELYARRLYRTYTLMDINQKYDNRSIVFTFLNKPAERVLNRMTSVNSMKDLTRIVSSSSSLNKLGEGSESDNDSTSATLLPVENKEKISSQTVRTGVFALVDSIEDLTDANKMESILSQFPSGANAPINVLNVVVVNDTIGIEESSSDVMAERCHGILGSVKASIEKSAIRRITFSFRRNQGDDFNEYVAPATFTFSTPELKEESLIRGIDPSHAIHLDLPRAAANFKIRTRGVTHTSISHTHLYECTPKSSALEKDKKANKAPRIFVRAVSFSLEFSSANYERILVDALNAIDLCSQNKRSDNHLFINLVSDFEKSVLDPVVVEQVIMDILKRHGHRVLSLGIVEVETKIVCALSADSPPLALRLVASNPTGYVHVMNTYVEAADETSDDRVFKLIGGTKASLASTGDSSWEGLSVNTPYPLTRPFDAQRKTAARYSDTLYCYDLPALFETAVEQQWAEAAGKGLGLGSRPLMVMYTTELVVKLKDASVSAPWTMKDYLGGNLELVQMNRGAGANDVGMVAWLMSLKTVEYPEGRQVILIANDITFKAGSFGTREDVVFKLASEYARDKRIPRLFVAANSGARIGLADSVKKVFKVAFKDTSKPENGFDFLYVTKDDYDTLTTDKQRLIAQPDTFNGQDIYRITDIIGSEPDLGVENLKGSGLIAGETSAAYEDIFTMTIVLGRTVGIGAYLVRLGQRTIQKTSSSPIILTGYQALNKLMGTDVYSTNDQLGGPGIMYPNGISHIIKPDHLSSVKASIEWLSYVPSARGGLLPITDIRGIDEIERPIAFSPSAGTPYDPRMLIAGGEDDMGVWKSGFFDRGSFSETLSGWAKTVVVGRARLGGIPMGVIITENRTAENVKPADPADLKASEAVIQEAGCVWFPNSAYKTAQAINDFRTEDLPLIVFANWRGFSGGQRDMFDEVLKYGSLIVDAFVAYEQPVFVFIPPFAEIRGGAWVVLDASINANVMEMYAAKGSARGGVLEANGAASVKYRTKDLITTMHRLDDTLVQLDSQLEVEGDAEKQAEIKRQIAQRESALLPVYEQISVQFCELHDTPGRMQAVGVIEKQVEWEHSRTYFYWRLRRKLAEFDLRKKIVDASSVGRGIKAPTPLEATDRIKTWFVNTGMDEAQWKDDKEVLMWMGQNNALLEQKVVEYTKNCVVQEVFQVMTAGGGTAKVGTNGIVEGITKAFATYDDQQQAELRAMLSKALQLN